MLTDLWSWDGEAWKLIDQNGPEVFYASFAFDSLRGALILHSGMSADSFGNCIDLNTKTWEWDGATWVEKSDVYPEWFDRGPMVFDRARGVSVLLRDFEYDIPGPKDTWEWDGVDWTRTSLRPPSTNRRPSYTTVPPHESFSSDEAKTFTV